MTDLPLRGHLGLERTATGVVPRRLPERSWPQLVDRGLQLVTAMPAGVRLSFASGPAWLELDVMLTRIQVLDLAFDLPAFDVVVDGAVTGSVLADGGTVFHITGPGPADVELRVGPPTTVRVELPTEPGHVVEVWLPHAAVVELRDVRSDVPLEAAELRQRHWVHHGSSISHCLEATSPTGTWPAVAALQAGVALTNLGFGGQCMLDQHTARAMRDTPADLLSLKAGINVVNGDTMRERTYRAALHGFLDTVRDGHPETPFVLISPIVCPPAEDHPGPTTMGPDGRWTVVPRSPELSVGSLTLQAIRALSAEVVEARCDPHLHLLDGRELFGPDDVEDLPDALHPNAAGYRRMGARFHAYAFGAGGPFATQEVS